MRRRRTSKSTIRRDPFAVVIPAPPVEAVETAPPEPEPLPDQAPPPAEPRTARRRRAAPPHPPGEPGQGHEMPPARRDDPPPAAGPGRQKLTVHLDGALVDRVKNAAYWNPRLTIAKIAELGIRHAIERIEKDHGGRYPRRESDLVGGRPIK